MFPVTFPLLFAWEKDQYVASLCGIIAGGVLLCCYQKGVYVCTPIVYIVAAVFDLVAAISWLVARRSLAPRVSFSSRFGLRASREPSVSSEHYATPLAIDVGCPRF